MFIYLLTFLFIYLFNYLFISSKSMLPQSFNNVKEISSENQFCRFLKC